MTTEFKKLKPLIQKARRIVIACHTDPDADTLGSASGSVFTMVSEKVPPRKRAYADERAPPRSSTFPESVWCASAAWSAVRS